ncbi:MAG TPA: GNAT family protein [Phenylobacterium sp.]|jgi:RimJ/RimL family protein N-acetyltransferase
MRLEPVVLENRFVRLEPMGEAHRAEFRAACAADPETWNELYPYSMLGEAFETNFTRFYLDNAADRIGFAVIAGGRVVGTSSFLRIDPANASVEIGGTYYHPDFRGGPTNPSAKRLLMGEAFGRGARRVQFRVDAINARSRAAVLKLGATEEGVMRRDMQTWTGRIRDSVVFSVIDEEWPAVRERLDARLAQFD